MFVLNKLSDSEPESMEKFDKQKHHKYHSWKIKMEKILFF